MTTAFIRLETKYNPVTAKAEVIRYAWEGDSNNVSISTPLMEDMGHSFSDATRVGFKFSIGPYRLRVVEFQPWLGGIIATRERGFVTDAYIEMRRALWILEWIYRRLIITLAIWRLADWQEAAVPTWRDVKLLKWLAGGYTFYSTAANQPHMRVWLWGRELSSLTTQAKLPGLILDRKGQGFGMLFVLDTPITAGLDDEPVGRWRWGWVRWENEK